MNRSSASPIGIFDSGYGGLTVFRAIHDALPSYDYLYLGDNARAPYGNRSYDTIHQYTWQCVQWFFNEGCPLVILACNTASAKALRIIQQQDLPKTYPDRRVLGVIRPTAEVIGSYTKTGVVGVLGTKGTVQSRSYELEIRKFFPDIKVIQQACPLWVPLVENGEQDSPGADYFIGKYLQELQSQSPDIDTLLLACTHYPLMEDRIRAALPDKIQVVSQGPLVAASLKDYLDRHPEMEQRISRGGSMRFCTTDDAEDFNTNARQFFGSGLNAAQVHL